MRILLLITGLGMGGAEKVVTNLADAFVLKGHEVRIAYMTGSAVVLPKNNNVQVINLGMKRKVDIFFAFLKLKKLIDDFQPDVVHSHMVHANIFSRLVRLVVPLNRLITTAHNSNEGGALRMIAYRVTDRLADISTNVSHEAVAAFEKARAVRPGKMIAVHNGVEVEKFSFNADARDRLRRELLKDERSKLILAVGRLEEAKDYKNLFEALAKLDCQGVNYHLCIAGDGRLRANLLKLVEQLKLTSCVSFLGVRGDVADLMSAADVFVLPSAWEGFGLVVAEAMACSRVVVATDCGGVREVVGSSGFLVPPKNSIALAQALRTALQLPQDKIIEYGCAARCRIMERYSLDKAVDRWLQIYRVT